MKNAIPLLLLLSILISCSQKNTQSNQKEEIAVDTLYTSKDDPNFYRWKIEFADLTGKKDITFDVGNEQVIKVWVSHLEEYPAFIYPESNIEITKMDTINGIYHIIPTASDFSFEVRLDFGVNKAVQKHRNGQIDTLIGKALVGWQTVKAQIPK